jgi:hypothetical protein
MRGHDDTLMTAVLVLAGLAINVGIGWLILQLYRWYRGRAEAVVERAYAGLKTHWPPGEDDVTLHFHTYYGFFVFFTQIEHRVALPADQAFVLLQRLHRINLLWGLLCPFVLAAPVLSLVHYWGQIWSIRRQERRKLA